MEISFCSHPNTNKVIATIFGTWHDSWAVVACAKCCCDMIISSWIRAKWNFHHIWIVMEKSLVKWVPASVWLRTSSSSCICLTFVRIRWWVINWTLFSKAILHSHKWNGQSLVCITIWHPATTTGLQHKFNMLLWTHVLYPETIDAATPVPMNGNNHLNNNTQFVNHHASPQRWCLRSGSPIAVFKRGRFFLIEHLSHIHILQQRCQIFRTQDTNCQMCLSPAIKYSVAPSWLANGKYDSKAEYHPWRPRVQTPYTHWPLPTIET